MRFFGNIENIKRSFAKFFRFHNSPVPFMRIEQNQDELIVRENTGCMWIFGAFFIFVGSIFLYGTLGGFSNYDEIPFWQIALAFFMALCAVSVGIWIIYVAPFGEIIINRHDETIKIIKRGLGGRRETNFRFAEVERFCLIEETDDEGSLVWFFGLEKTNGEIVKITSVASRSEQNDRACVFEINEFARKQLSPSAMIIDGEDESRSEIS